MEYKKNVYRKIRIVTMICLVFLVMLFIVIVFGTITMYNTSKNFARSHEYHPERNAKKEAKKYFEYLKNQDIQNLCKLFSQNVQNSHDLEKEWTEFFESIDGNIVSYKRITYLGEEVNVDDYKVSYSDIVIRFEDVKTDKGKFYERIDYRELRVDISCPEAEGISIFSILIPAKNEKGFQEVNVGETFN